ncbi:sulfide dehydrogenase [flavocytochrome c] flavoprotein chain precursor [bacterium BMS3Abin02]|nr:sulfide dehydrogenase [flavocytochrome c] flavoprotein chain precursor [bacterium BMS3Abin02]GBE21446.1 sulfide dehydrogenase [flavocytochrome c] flavoprotein chain precursor [bacterium BMS3Bbin01]HDH26507.1 NAD(P)/FAD-dependent oxidoreductase [Actinomycetota bacterium]
MRKLLVLGAGTAGTMVVNKMSHHLDPDEWQITIVDQEETHYYQPGFLFIPFGMYGRNDVIKAKRDYIPIGIEMIVSEIDLIEADKNRVKLVKGDRRLDYDYLVIATGTHPRLDQTPGLLDEEKLPENVHTFYTLEGAVNLAKYLRSWEGGRLVLNIMEYPFKCPVAPLEFIFLADWWFTEQGLRDKVDLTFVTPLPGAFTKPIASRALGGMLEEKKITLVPDFMPERVDPDRNTLVAFDEEEVEYDLLVTVPVSMGADVIGRSGLGDELNHVPVDKETFVSKKHDNIFALGDAAALPTSKAGSVAHFAVDVWTENFLRYIDGLPMLEKFDGHANCFIESGFGKGLLIDFNYDTEPLPGKYPLPGVGPFSLLQESEMNHWGKMMFRWMYWNVLLKGKEMPVTSYMTMAGKWS